ncbi:unnamed protein product [Paramecium octaurelia]|uniref:C2H2-type domain-containing protein n=1 Tax=Paramecium octaurelia TaxID=43137 RepID=A0A8S1TKZ6_PAROT|nr:unnamed protein product [Paramecium octaurelia]
MKYEHSDKIEEQTIKLEELITQVQQDLQEIQQYKTNCQIKCQYCQLVHNTQNTSFKNCIQNLFQKSKQLINKYESNQNKTVLVNKFRSRKQLLLKSHKKRSQEGWLIQQIQKWNEFLKSYERTKFYPGKMAIHKRWTFYVIKVYHCQYCLKEFKSAYRTKYHMKKHCRKRSIPFAEKEPIVKNKIIKTIFKQF